MRTWTQKRYAMSTCETTLKQDCLDTVLVMHHRQIGLLQSIVFILQSQAEKAERYQPIVVGTVSHNFLRWVQNIPKATQLFKRDILACIIKFCRDWDKGWQAVPGCSASGEADAPVKPPNPFSPPNVEADPKTGAGLDSCREVSSWRHMRLLIFDVCTSHRKNDAFFL